MMHSNSVPYHSLEIEEWGEISNLPVTFFFPLIVNTHTGFPKALRRQLSHYHNKSCLPFLEIPSILAAQNYKNESKLLLYKNIRVTATNILLQIKIEEKLGLASLHDNCNKIYNEKLIQLFGEYMFSNR